MEAAQKAYSTAVADLNKCKVVFKQEMEEVLNEI